MLVASPPTAVALEPKGLSGSLPSPFISFSLEGSTFGGAAKPLALTGRPGSSGVGGAASMICGTKTPAEASRLAA